MQGVKKIVPKMLYQVHIDDLVPKDNFYRKLNAALDLNFLYAATKKYYGTEGQESVDPVVFFKTILIGYFNNINSDRHLMAYCADSLGIRLFLEYDIDEKLPWHSTISRTRQLFGEEVFLMLFRKILSMCVKKGMVRGKRQAVDSAYVKANASLDSLVEKEIIDDAGQYAEELNENSEFKINPNTITPKDKGNIKVSGSRKKAVDQHHKWKEEAYKNQPSNANSKQVDEHGNLIRPRYLSNHTHHSPTDPDARISVKPGKARQLNYYAQIAVDDAHHVITASGADFADKRDSECLPHILKQNIENLQGNQIQPEQVLADTGYSSGEALQFCKDNNIEAFIPNFGQYKPEREGFIYNDKQNQYECIRGNKAILTYRKNTIDSKGYEKKVYRSDNSRCKNCPLRSKCIGKSDFKKIEDSIHRHHYDHMHQKLKGKYAQRIMKRRGSIVEPVLGTMINFQNLKRINTRGIKQANKHVMMAALTYNLKKYLKFIGKKSNAKTIALKGAIPTMVKTAFADLIRAFIGQPKFQNLQF